MAEQTGRPLATGPEFHWQQGWCFARVVELGEMWGAVRLRYVRKEHIPASETMPGGNHEVCSEFFIPAAEWASVVAAVTPEGDNAFTYRVACALHDVPRNVPRTSPEPSAEEPSAPEKEVYCPHMRPGGWKSCPHCSGVNSAVPQSSEPEKETE